MKQPPITLSQFTDAINSLQTASDFQDGLCNYLHNFEHNSHQCCVDLGPLIYPDCSDGLLKLLQVVMHDTDDTIGWWCYDLSFGREWEEGDFEDENGNDIPMQTVQQLYQYLADNYDKEEVTANV